MVCSYIKPTLWIVLVHTYYAFLITSDNRHGVFLEEEIDIGDTNVVKIFGKNNEFIGVLLKSDDQLNKELKGRKPT